MTTDITTLRLHTAVDTIKRAFIQELTEMARYQPVRFYDVKQAMLDLVSYGDEDLDDDSYEVAVMSSMMLDLLDSIPPKRLLPKPRAA